MIKIITTADDYAISKGVNDAIIECIDNGCLTSVNVMVNMPYLDNRLINYQNKISVGIHFNLTVGKCISNPKNIDTLVDSNGCFYEYNVFVKRVKKGLIKREHIRNELKAQLKFFVSFFGFNPIYWNTHQNIVLNKKIMSCFFEVGKEQGIKFTRTYCRAYLDYKVIHGKRKIREFLVRNYVRYLYNFKYSSFASTTDYREIVFDRKNKNNPILFSNMLSSCGQNKSIEIVYHPSTNLDCPYFGTIGQERIEEYLFLKEKSNVFLSALRENEAELITYELL